MKRRGLTHRARLKAAEQEQRSATFLPAQSELQKQVWKRLGEARRAAHQRGRGQRCGRVGPEGPEQAKQSPSRGALTLQDRGSDAGRVLCAPTRRPADAGDASLELRASFAACFARLLVPTSPGSLSAPACPELCGTALLFSPCQRASTAPQAPRGPQLLLPLFFLMKLGCSTRTRGLH